MRFAVNLMPTVPVSEVVGLAVHAERCGASRVWVYDEGVVTRDVYVTLAAIAAATERVHMGPGITNPYVRHPAATAAAVASLDELSGGRAFVGLGVGGGLTLGPLGLQRPSPVAVLADTVSALRGLFAGEVVDLESASFRLRSARLDYGRPDIPIVLAGRGPRVTALGGNVADGFYLSYIHRELLAEHVAALRSSALGRDFEVMYSTAVAMSEADIDAVRAQLTFRLVDSPPEVRALLGLGDAQVARIRARLARGGPTAAADEIDPGWVGQFAIAGSVDHCAAQLRQLETTGDIDEFVLPIQSPEAARDLISAVAAMIGTDT